MKILITNDDGIDSDGLIRLSGVACKYGEVYVFAPNGQCSAMSHRITLREHIDVYEVKDFPVSGVKAYRVDGTPADCVRIGIMSFIKEIPDLVLSGINFGYNCGTDIQYSGTVAAALEGASEGAHSIAFSEGANGVHEVTDLYLEEMLKTYMNKALERNQIWNINFPECKMQDFKGILTERKIADKAFYDDGYSIEELPDGGLRLRVCGEYKECAPEGTDVRACIDNYISIGTVKNVS
ncbi:MAG: 5'/3'-nucleotidase SurE [Lachnospiraceae bacterium]|nr:5'/3'-nucleotidase SurE [Lachnospiraceae bacterium]